MIRLKLAVYKFEIGTGIFLFWISISDAKSDVISRIESWQASVHSKSKIQRCPLYGTRHPSIAIFPSMVREKIGSDWSSFGRIPLAFVGVFLDLDLIRQQRQESVTQRIFTEMIPIEFNFRNVSWTIRTLPTKLEMFFSWIPFQSNRSMTLWNFLARFGWMNSKVWGDSESFSAAFRTETTNDYDLCWRN